MKFLAIVAGFVLAAVALGSYLAAFVGKVAAL